MALKSQTTTIHFSNENAETTAVGSATFAKIGEVTNIGAPSGEAADIDVSHLESEAKEYLVGLPDEGTVEVSANAISGDAGHDQLLAAKASQERRWLKIIWSNGDIWTIQSLCKKYTWAAAVDQKIDCAISLRLSGGWTRS